MTGTRVGKLEVLHEGPPINEMRAYWCRCDCGEEILRQEYYLKRGPRNQSCGVRCKGRKHVLDDDQKKIVENYYEWMIKQVRWNWVRNWPDLEDEILSASDEGIMRAAFYFNKNKGSSFNWLCILHVNRVVRRELEREVRVRRFLRSLVGRVERLRRGWDHQRRP